MLQEVFALRRQVNAAVENTDVYTTLKKDLEGEQLKTRATQISLELAEKTNRKLRNANAELKEKYDTILAAYNALKNDFNVLSVQVKADKEKTLKNARGAGRKAALSKEAKEEVRDMHQLGMSYRNIAKKMGVSTSVIARTCQN